MRVSVYIATSLDGFIARRDGDIDWLPAPSDPEDGEDYGFSAFFDTVDCMVIVRKTMEKVLGFGVWPYEGKRVLVLSKTLAKAPPHLVGKVELCSKSPAALVARLENEGYQRVYVDGGKTLQSFIREDLVTDLTVTRIPVLIGDGLPLFGQLEHDVTLTHKATRSYPSGLVQSTYVVT